MNDAGSSSVRDAAYNRYLANMFNHPGRGGQPPSSLFLLPLIEAGKRSIGRSDPSGNRPITNWEWIIVDDSDDDGKTFKLLTGLAKKDHRIQVFKPWEHSGVIGKVKNWACSLGKGQILVELDHDDELTDYALDYVVKGFEQFPEAGFLYTDCAEISETAKPHLPERLGLRVRLLYAMWNTRARCTSQGTPVISMRRRFVILSQLLIIYGPGGRTSTNRSGVITKTFTWQTITRSSSGLFSKPG